MPRGFEKKALKTYSNKYLICSKWTENAKTPVQTLLCNVNSNFRLTLFIPFSQLKSR